ncbi:MAG TPA: PQQ-dependent sugar dehydrogenase [Chitinophagaceae bacterium]|nr:PQQ-dependent sugar dehydrogenase [Chitinophagaceae bacterium]
MPKRNFFIILPLATILLITSCNPGNTAGHSALPGPVTESQNPDSLYKEYELDKIHLPDGFKINVYAQVPGARSLCASPGGTLFVGTREHNVYAVTDENKDGKADKIYTIAAGLNAPNGVAFRDGSLYIGAISAIYRLDSIESKLSNPPAPVVVYDKYPTDKHHGYKFIAFGPDGKLYVPVGAPCNICEPAEPYASMTRMNPDGSGFEIFAKGIRNTVRFAWNPANNQLWFTDNGRDNLGDDIPSDELNTAPKEGMNFGYPYCHEGDILDPEFGKGKNCSDYTPPVKKLGAHVASLGMRFYTGDMFPADYKNAIFIAEHGSWNRTTPVGYRVVVAKMDSSGNFSDPVPFAGGWLRNANSVNGRPVDVQVLKDGSLLVSDDYKGLIYRITYLK